MLLLLILPVLSIFITEMIMWVLDNLGLLSRVGASTTDKLWLVLYCIVLASSISGYVVGTMV